MCAHTRANVPITCCACGGQRTGRIRWFSPSTIGVELVISMFHLLTHPDDPLFF